MHNPVWEKRCLYKQNIFKKKGGDHANRWIRNKMQNRYAVSDSSETNLTI